MITVALLECKSGAIEQKEAHLRAGFHSASSEKPHNTLCINTLSPNAQNSRISHQRFLSALNEEY